MSVSKPETKPAKIDAPVKVLKSLMDAFNEIRRPEPNFDILSAMDAKVLFEGALKAYNRSGLTKTNAIKAVMLRMSGYPLTVFAEAFNCSRALITQIAKEIDYEPLNKKQVALDYLIEHKGGKNEEVAEQLAIECEIAEPITFSKSLVAGAKRDYNKGLTKATVQKVKSATQNGSENKASEGSIKEEVLNGKVRIVKVGDISLLTRENANRKITFTDGEYSLNRERAIITWREEDIIKIKGQYIYLKVAKVTEK